MVVSIVGWYGTETCGDRAILDGILSVLGEIEENAIVQLGSLFPFYSKRTLLEEENVLKKTAPQIRIDIFDIKDKAVLNDSIRRSDLLIMGGGPLMDLEELYLIERAFKLSKRKGIPSVVMGCGIGPLKEKKYISLVKKILENSTKISLRDKKSAQTLERLWPEQFVYECLGDPAIISVENYMEISHREKKSYLAVNFRDFPGEQYGDNSSVSILDIRMMLNDVAPKYEKIYLVPMHTFHVGNDDRTFLTKIQSEQCAENIEVLHKPLNLHELYEVYENAKGCIGMRYHSVVMQTLLNGNNLIFDYTDPNTGKIAGFLDIIGCEEFYEDRKICLKDCANKDLRKTAKILCDEKSYSYQISEMKSKYVKLLESIR